MNDGEIPLATGNQGAKNGCQSEAMLPGNPRQTAETGDFDPTPASLYDGEMVRRWLRYVHGRAEGLIAIAHQDDHGEFHAAGQIYDDPAAAAAAIDRLERTRPQGIYLRCTSLAARPKDGRRGTAGDSLALPMFWCDVDFGDAGHAAPGPVPLPPDEDAARLIVTSSGLPEPTAWVHSGGGLYAFWTLEPPELIGGAIAEAAEVSKAVQSVLAVSAGRLGYHYGRGVGDLARVLRVPGTVNRKTITERPCRLLDASGPSYSYREFADQVLPMAENRRGAHPPGPRPGAEASAGPFDVLARRASWADILEPAGYTFVRRESHGGELWRRPCGPDDVPSSEYSVRCQVHGVSVAVNFSEAGPLPVGEGHRLTKGRVFAHLYHGGDESAAARDLIAASRGDSSATSAAVGLPEAVLRVIRAVADGDSAAVAVTDPWWQQNPLPLVERRTLPEFPSHALPGPVKDMVLAVAEATQTDPGMAGTTALAMLAIAAGGCVEIEAKRGWREPLNLYTAVVAGPGERKSAVQALMAQPLVEAERALVEEGRKERLEIETAREIALKAAEQARRSAVRANGEARERLTKEAIQLAEAAAAMPVPVVPRLLADDVTPEACAFLLAEQDGRLGIVFAEGGIFDVIGGRYSGNIPVLDVWLKGHSGDALRVDRKGREPEYVRKPALTLALMIQPTVLAAVAQNPAFRGRGLVARFLFALPASKVGRRNAEADGVPEQVADAYSKLLHTLVEDLAGWKSDPVTLWLDDEAAAYLLQIQGRVETQLGKGGVLHYIIDWGAKRVGATLRIAGLLHLAERPIDGWRHPVPLHALQCAEQIMEYYQRHAIEAFAAMKADPVIADAEYVLDRIADRGESIVSTRDLHAVTSRTRFRKVTDLHPVLDVLEQHGYIARMPEPAYAGVGRRPSRRWSVHPDVLARDSACS